VSKLITFIVIPLITLSSYANINPVDLDNDTSIIITDTIIQYQKDTIYLEKIQIKENLQAIKSQDNMPWIGAILIGILTVFANILISRYSRISNKEITEKQINTSKEIALEEIESSRHNTQIEFNKTVLSGNRQQWIADLRELISKILSSTMSLSLKGSMSHQELEHLRFLITKVELMLNAVADKNFIDALTELENCCIEIQIGNKKFSDLKEYSDEVKEYAKITLKTEWERVKKGE